MSKTYKLPAGQKAKSAFFNMLAEEERMLCTAGMVCSEYTFWREQGLQHLLLNAGGEDEMFSGPTTFELEGFGRVDVVAWSGRAPGPQTLEVENGEVVGLRSHAQAGRW